MCVSREGGGGGCENFAGNTGRRRLKLGYTSIRQTIPNEFASMSFSLCVKVTYVSNCVCILNKNFNSCGSRIFLFLFLSRSSPNISKIPGLGPGSFKRDIYYRVFLYNFGNSRWGLEGHVAE